MKDFFPKDMRSTEIKKELNGVKEWEERIKRKDLKYETNRYFIFDNLKWCDHLVIVFIMVKLA